MVSTLLLFAIGAPIARGVDLEGYRSASENLYFSSNVGQWDSSADFVSRSSNLDVWVTKRGLTYDLHETVAQPEIGRGFAAMGEKRQSLVRTGQVIRATFLGCSAATAEVAADKKAAYENYLLGVNSARHVSTYGAVAETNLYPGIDLVSYFDPQTSRPRYDLVVKPGADPSKIRIRYEGADSVSVDGEGQVCLGTRFGAVTERGLAAFQTDSGWAPAMKSSARRVSVQPTLVAPDTVGFRLTGYRSDQWLVIDPMIWCTYGGGSGIQRALSMFRTTDGGMVVGGDTEGTGFPASPGAYQSTSALLDGFLAKYNAQGNTVWRTYLGGDRDDGILSICEAPSGEIFATGYTTSYRTFPTSESPFQSHGDSTNLSTDAFISRISGDGSFLNASTFLSGSNVDVGTGIATDSSGNPVVAGYTGSHQFPITAGTAQTYHGGGDFDAFVVKMTPELSGMIWGSFLGGLGDDYATSLAVDGSDRLEIVGATSSTNFPSVAALQPFYGGGAEDGFITKLEPSADVYDFSSYMGGTDDDLLLSVRDVGGRPVFGGTSASSNFPTTAGVLQTTNGGSYDAVFGKLTPAGRPVFISLFGGGLNDSARSVALDKNGGLYLGMQTSSYGMPATPDSYQTVYAEGNSDGGIARIDSNGTLLGYFSYLGGTDEDAVESIAVDGSRNVYAAGRTWSSDFPVAFFSDNHSWSGREDIFALKMNLVPAATKLELFDVQPLSVVGGGIVTTTAQLNNAASDFTLVNVHSSNEALISSYDLYIPIPRRWQSYSVYTPVLPSGGSKRVTLTASFSGKSISRTVTILPIFTIGISPASVTGGSSATVTVTLSEPALGDVTLDVSDNSSFASTPATVTVPGGSTSATFEVDTTHPPAIRNAKIKVSYGGCTQTVTLTINP